MSALARVALRAAALALLVAAPAAALEASRALSAGLARSGRAEATLAWTVPGPPGGAATALRGTLALERPALARLDVAGTGERITLREDGGEWLQPSLRQFVRLTPRHSVAAMRWWRLLAGGGGVVETRLGPGRWRLVVPATPAAEADSADVWLDARGLPARLDLADGMGGRSTYRLRGWRFTPAKGAAAFRLEPPAGVEVVELP